MCPVLAADCQASLSDPLHHNCRALRMAELSLCLTASASALVASCFKRATPSGRSYLCISIQTVTAFSRAVAEAESL